jgi:hypothetical protein
MLTCEQIAEKARAINPKITRENYADIADTILNPVDRTIGKLSDWDSQNIAYLPEVMEYQKAQHYQITSDWVDCVVFRVAIQQKNAAVNRYLARSEATP